MLVRPDGRQIQRTALIGILVKGHSRVVDFQETTAHSVRNQFQSLCSSPNAVLFIVVPLVYLCSAALRRHKITDANITRLATSSTVGQLNDILREFSHREIPPFPDDADISNVVIDGTCSLTRLCVTVSLS